jgi:hypothetical protein
MVMPALALEDVVVHDAFLDGGVLAKGVRGAEDVVDERGLAMVDVGDDGDVSGLAGGAHGTGCFLGGVWRAGVTMKRTRRRRSLRCGAEIVSKNC